MRMSGCANGLAGRVFDWTKVVQHEERVQFGDETSDRSAHYEAAALALLVRRGEAKRLAICRARSSHRERMEESEKECRTGAPREHAAGEGRMRVSGH